MSGSCIFPLTYGRGDLLDGALFSVDLSQNASPLFSQWRNCSGGWRTPPSPFLHGILVGLRRFALKLFKKKSTAPSCGLRPERGFKSHGASLPWSAFCVDGFRVSPHFPFFSFFQDGRIVVF